MSLEKFVDLLKRIGHPEYVVLPIARAPAKHPVVEGRDRLRVSRTPVIAVVTDDLTVMRALLDDHEYGKTWSEVAIGRLVN